MKYILLVGAQKAGSTYLHNLLAQDPVIAVHPKKEPHYFSKNFAGRSYHSFFRINQKTDVILDSSAMYLHIDGTADRVKNALGEGVTIAAVLRDPVKRAVSAYLHNVKHGRELRPAEEVFALDSTCAADVRVEESENIQKASKRGLVHLDRTGKGFLDPAVNYRYASNSHYDYQLRQYFELFPSVTLVDFDKLVQNPQSAADTVRRAAGLARFEDYDTEVGRNETAIRPAQAMLRRRKFNGLFSATAAIRLFTQNYDKKHIERAAGSPWAESAVLQYKMLFGGKTEPPMST